MRGRGATPRREFVRHSPTPNPSGYTRLTYRYRPLKHWRTWTAGGTITVADQLDLAERAIGYFFDQVGGFLIANDALVRGCYDALDALAVAQTGFDPALLLSWAIDAEATRVAALKDKRYRGTAASFFAERYQAALESSPRFRDRVARAAQQDRAAAFDLAAVFGAEGRAALAHFDENLRAVNLLRPQDYDAAQRLLDFRAIRARLRGTGVDLYDPRMRPLFIARTLALHRDPQAWRAWESSP